MPNLTPPITNVTQALAYRSRILDALPAGSVFEPLMTLYLTAQTTVADIEEAAATKEVVGVKFYPKGATTNSEAGVEGLEGHDAVLDALERLGLPLLVHGESMVTDCDVFDREAYFLDQTLAPLVERHPALRVVFEHITTARAANFVRDASTRVAATITPQHLLMNRNALFDGGLRPHHYCLPVLKREADREVLVAAATSGDPSFFLGTDSAPHQRSQKESNCGCAGIFSAPIAIEAYVEAFARADKLAQLDGFASHHGPDFYALPRNSDRIRFERVDWIGPARDGEGEGALEIFWAGTPLRYRFRESA
jgi:dihydroorotase